MFGLRMPSAPIAPKPEIEKDYDNPFDEILDKLDAISTRLATISSRVLDLEAKIEKNVDEPMKKLAAELADAKAQLRKNTDFTQSLVLELICKPRIEVKQEPAAKEPSSVLKDYLARKAANGGDHKPKLP